MNALDVTSILYGIGGTVLLFVPGGQIPSAILYSASSASSAASSYIKGDNTNGNINTALTVASAIPILGGPAHIAQAANIAFSTKIVIDGINEDDAVKVVSGSLGIVGSGTKIVGNTRTLQKVGNCVNIASGSVTLGKSVVDFCLDEPDNYNSWEEYVLTQASRISNAVAAGKMTVDAAKDLDRIIKTEKRERYLRRRKQIEINNQNKQKIETKRKIEVYDFDLNQIKLENGKMLELKTGDKICYKFGPFNLLTHYATYAGDGQIIERNSNGHKKESNPSSYDGKCDGIRYTKIDKGKNWQLEASTQVLSRDHQIAIHTRVNEVIYLYKYEPEKLKGYSLYFENCEHFSNFMYSNYKYSSQLDLGGTFSLTEKYYKSSGDYHYNDYYEEDLVNEYRKEKYQRLIKDYIYDPSFKRK